MENQTAEQAPDTGRLDHDLWERCRCGASFVNLRNGDAASLCDVLAHPYFQTTKGAAERDDFVTRNTIHEEGSLPRSYGGIWVADAASWRDFLTSLELTPEQHRARYVPFHEALACCGRSVAETAEAANG